MPDRRNIGIIRLVVLLALTAGVLIVLGGEPAEGRTIFVDDDAPDGGDGSDTMVVTELSHRCLDCKRVFDVNEFQRPIRLSCPGCKGFRIEKIFK